MGYTCTTCGVWHDTRATCFISPVPNCIAALSDDETAARVDRSSDQCIFDGEHYFILGNLDVPVHGPDERIRWTVWTTLSAANFERANELWQTPGRESEPAYSCWLSNHIPGYPDTLSIRALVRTQPVGIRPQIEVVEDGHPLGRDQRDGIAPVRADELIHAALH